MQEYTGLARRIAQRYLPYCGGAVDLDDLMQAAAIGAMQAEASYSPDKGTWASWCAFYIRKEMRAAIGIRSTKLDPSMNALSLDMPMNEDGLTLADTLEDDERVLVEEAEMQELCKVVREEVAALQYDRRRVVEMVDIEGKTKTKTAKMLGYTAHRLNVIRQEAYRDLRYNPRLCALAIAHGCRVPERRRMRYGHGLNPDPLGLDGDALY